MARSAGPSVPFLRLCYAERCSDTTKSEISQALADFLRAGVGCRRAAGARQGGELKLVI